MKEDILKNGLETLGYQVTDKQIEQFNKYFEMLVETNKYLNLTAITEYNEVVLKHFVDSASLIHVAEKHSEIHKMLYSEGSKLLDLGTGAGFPGIPLKILYPNLDITLMDSLNKRLVFLDSVIKELGLTGIKTVHARAEEFARKEEYREQYDFVVSRAVARMSTLTEFCFAYVKKGGYFLPYKAGGALEEIEEGAHAIDILGGKLEDTIEFSLPNSDILRCIPVVKKIKNTPDKYPRVGRKAEKNPL